MQIQADISGREVHQSQVPDLSALGAAHLAGLGGGLWSQAELEGLDRPARVFGPRTSAAERRQLLGAWHHTVSQARTTDPFASGGTA